MFDVFSYQQCPDTCMSIPAASYTHGYVSHLYNILIFIVSENNTAQSNSNPFDKPLDESKMCQGLFENIALAIVWTLFIWHIALSLNNPEKNPIESVLNGRL